MPAGLNYTLTLDPEDVRNLRKRWGLDQGAFANLIGVGNSTVVGIENKYSPTYQSTIRLIQFLMDDDIMVRFIQKFGYLMDESDYKHLLTEILNQDVPEKIHQLASGDITVQEFARWFAPVAFYAEDKQLKPSLDLPKIDLLLMEWSDGNWTNEEVKEFLGQMI